jgi:hypothetical protein
MRFSAPVDDLAASDLPIIDLTAESHSWRIDPRSFEDAYAQLAFGLGTVPRRQHRDDPFLQTPAGVLTIVGLLILLLFAST